MLSSSGVALCTASIVQPGATVRVIPSGKLNVPPSASGVMVDTNTGLSGALSLAVGRVAVSAAAKTTITAIVAATTAAGRRGYGVADWLGLPLRFFHLRPLVRWPRA